MYYVLSYQEKKNRQVKKMAQKWVGISSYNSCQLIRRIKLKINAKISAFVLNVMQIWDRVQQINYDSQFQLFSTF